MYYYSLCRLPWISAPAQSLEFGGVVGAALAAKMQLLKQQALQRAAEKAQAQSLAAGMYTMYI